MEYDVMQKLADITRPAGEAVVDRRQPSYSGGSTSMRAREAPQEANR